MAHAAGMHHDVVQVPEVNVGQIMGQDFLYARVDFAAAGGIHFATALGDELIHFRIGVVAAVGASGSEAGGIEDVFEDVGVLVGAKPAHGKDLKGAIDDIGIKAGK